MAYFALSPFSKYKAKNAKDLAKKIDYWLSDDIRRNEEALKYVDAGKSYDIKQSIAELIKMYREVVPDKE